MLSVRRVATSYRLAGLGRHTGGITNASRCRELQKHYGQTPQVVITMPILEGLDGVQKMSKSLGNYIGIADAPDDMFGKLMSISDILMWRYLELLSFERAATLAAWRHEVEQGANPRDIKVRLAMEIVARFHGQDAAVHANQTFIARFRKGEIPDDMPEFQLVAVPMAGQASSGLLITHALRDAGLTSSTSDAQRMIQQGAVRIDGERIDDRNMIIKSGSSHIVQVGKRRFARILVR